MISDIVHIPLAPPPLAALRPFSLADWTQPFPFLGAGTGLEIGGPDWEGGWIVVEFTNLARVPEPEVLALVALTMIGLALRGRRSAL